MGCVLVREGEILAVKEFRHLRQGDLVAVGRGENGEDGIFVHTTGFTPPKGQPEKFSFRQNISREVTTKLGNRGSLSARTLLTNVQDFVVTVDRGLNGCPTVRA